MTYQDLYGFAWLIASLILGHFTLPPIHPIPLASICFWNTSSICLPLVFTCCSLSLKCFSDHSSYHYLTYFIYLFIFSFIKESLAYFNSSSTSSNVTPSEKTRLTTHPIDGILHYNLIPLYLLYSIYHNL